jgi:hypothetical protein
MGGARIVGAWDGSSVAGLQCCRAPGLQRSLGSPAWGAECSAGQGPVFAALRCIRAMRPTAAAAYMAWPTDGTGTYRSVQHAARSSAAAACGSPIESLHLGLGAWMHGCRRVVASLSASALHGCDGPGQSSALADLSTRPGPDKVGRGESRQRRLFNTGQMYINSSSLTTAFV